MIDYSKLNFYFDLKDEITNDIYSSLMAGINSKDPNVIEQLESDLDALMRSNESVDTILTDNEYCLALYKILFSYSFKVKLDITPYLIDIFIRHDYKNLFIKHFEEKIKKLHVTLVSHENIIQIANEFNTELICNTAYEILKLVTNQTKDVNDLRKLSTYLLDNYNDYLYRSDIEKHATIKTLSTFGGTLAQAKELVNNYLN